ncbi:hypothetical protein KEM52_000191 [Ascosphaera acerosa]|nr:hypothetical protein KEM52_000191 [Ascosphaera acerosa]
MYKDKPHPPPAHSQHRQRTISSATAAAAGGLLPSEREASPWLDPLFYGEGVADEKRRQQEAAAAAAAAHAQRARHHGDSYPGDAAAAAEAGVASGYHIRGIRRSRDFAEEKWRPAAAPSAFNGRKLVELARNGWESIKQASSVLGPDDPEWDPRGSGGSGHPRRSAGWRHRLRQLIGSPRRLFRLRTLIYLLTLAAVYVVWSRVAASYAEYREEHAILQSLDYRNRGRAGWFGANKVPTFEDFVFLKQLDAEFVPSSTPPAAGKRTSKRLVIVGDVHGCFEELQQLLNRIDFTPPSYFSSPSSSSASSSSSKALSVPSDSDIPHDHLIFTGGLIAGGPKSAAVVQLARKLSASCVRGFAEDRVLLTRSRMHAVDRLIREEKERGEDTPAKLAVLLGSMPGVVTPRELAERRLARELSDAQAEYLQSCPVMLRVGKIGGGGGGGGGGGTDLGEVVVVHGGLVPGVPLDEQDPATVMTVRTIDPKVHTPYDSDRGALGWAKVFNKEQQILAAAAADVAQKTTDRTPPADAGSEAREFSALVDPAQGVRTPTTVVYGHEYLSEPMIQRWTKGLNTACWLGGKLSALVIEDGGATSVVTVDCTNRKYDHHE